MKRYLSLVFLAFVVAVGSIVTSLVLPKDSLFSPSPATAQQADIRNGYAWLTLPSTGNQDDSWSCGANSIARVLAFYGRQTSYNTVRNIAQFDHGIIPTRLCVGSGILRTCVNTGEFKTGLEPNEVRSVLSNWEGGNAKYESGADLGKIKKLLSQGKPVIVLRRVRSFRPGRVFGTWPEMHWVAVHGYSDQDRKIYFTETDDGKAYELTYDKFMSEWDWRIGDGLASETFHRKGVKPKTIVWVDRTPRSLASSPSNSIPDSSSSSRPVFDPDFYLMSYGDLRNAFGTNQGAAKNHWLTHGIKEGRRSSPAFDVQYYLSLYPDLQSAFSSDYAAAINHWLTHGIKEGRRSSIVFDVQYYLNNYPDLQNAFGAQNYAAAINHWLTHGVSEGRRGSPGFDPKFYLSNNLDVARIRGANNYKGAIEHYLEFGRGEGRRGTP